MIHRTQRKRTGKGRDFFSEKRVGLKLALHLRLTGIGQSQEYMQSAENREWGWRLLSHGCLNILQQLFRRDHNCIPFLIRAHCRQ